jgi:phosphohistidine swiveling domain-containing protein
MTAVVGEVGFPGPDEIEGFWAFDKMHAPRPMTPLAGDLIVMPLADGFTEAQAEFDALVAVTNRIINYYYYASFHPVVDEADLAGRRVRYEQTLEEKVPGVGRLWTEEWQPQIERENRAERALDYTTFSDEQMLEKLAELEGRMRDYWRVHGRINFVLLSSAKYCDFYDEVVQPEDPTEAYQSLQGWETESLAASRGLWKLSRIVAASPGLKQIFDSTGLDDRSAALEGSEEGRAFLEELHRYLDQYGWRSDAVYDIADVTWREDPSIPLAALSSYVNLDESASPDVLQENSVRNREVLLDKARAKLADDPERLARFEELYEAARYSNPLTEDHAFWIDQMFIAIFRRFAEDLGRRLAERGQLARPEDVYMLYRDEVVDALRSGEDRTELAQQRRAEMEAWAKVTPPPTLGTPPEPEADPWMDAVTVRLLGITPPDDSPQDPDVLKGVAGSPGVARGPARVVRSLAEASVLEEGDIMVCEMTLPPWVPLFSIVAGVVADTGGVLSHCAIVAREFELPAVVGTLFGTTALTDGTMVEVDGTKGIVTILRD